MRSLITCDGHAPAAQKAMSARGVFMSPVTLTCVLVLVWTVITSHLVSFESEQRRHKPYSNSNTGTLAWPQLSPAAVRPQCRPVRVPISVLGRRPERCLTGEDDIYISIKTTRGNHKTRLPILILTWLQTVRPEQVLKT